MVALPEHVQLSLARIAESGEEGLLALAVGAGLAVLHERMEHEVTEVVGRRAASTPGAPPSVTGTRPERSRSVAGASRSAGRAAEPVGADVEAES